MITEQTSAPVGHTACSCRERIDAGLAQHNTRVEQVWILDGSRVGMPWPISTVQIEKGRGKPKAGRLIASFCPFCGVPLRRAAEPSK